MSSGIREMRLGGLARYNAEKVKATATHGVIFWRIPNKVEIAGVSCATWGKTAGALQVKVNAAPGA